MIQRLGRSFGPGRLERVQRGDGAPRWVLTWTDAAGRRHRQALSTDRRVAERLRSEIIRSRDMELAGLGGEAGQERLLDEILGLYLSDLGTRAVSEHIRNVRSRLDRLLVAIQAQRVRDLRPIELLQYRAARLKDGTSVRTVNLDTDSLRAMLTWAVRVDLIAANPIARLPRLPETEATKRCRRRALSEEEIGRFLAAAAADDRANVERIAAVKTAASATKGVQWSLRRRGLRVPQAPLWKAFLETGCRYGELVAVTWADADLDRRAIYLRAENTKAGRSREIPLLEGLVGELRALQPVQALALARPLRPGDRVFLTPEGCPWCLPTNNIMRIFDRLLEAAGIDRVDAQGRKLDVHALRHTMATRLARSGAPLVQAQQILGHSDPKLTARVYQHLEVEDLRGAVARLGGGVITGRRDAI
jgi:integrase